MLAVRESNHSHYTTCSGMRRIMQDYIKGCTMYRFDLVCDDCGHEHNDLEDFQTIVEAEEEARRSKRYHQCPVADIPYIWHDIIRH